MCETSKRLAAFICSFSALPVAIVRDTIAGVKLRLEAVVTAVRRVLLVGALEEKRRSIFEV